MKSVIFLSTILFCSLVGLSQTDNNATPSKCKIGFNLGVNYSNLQSKEPLPNGVEIVNGVGFRIGVIMDYSVMKNFVISPKLEFSYNNSSVEFSELENSTSTYNVFPMSIELMTHFVYKIGKGRLVPYFLIGPNFKLPIGKKTKTSTDFKTNPDLAIDFGIGLETIAKYFVFAPEIRYSYGFFNVNANPALQNLRFHNIALVLNFK